MELRASGLGYGEIAKKLSLSKTTVHKFCSRNICAYDTICKNCGKAIKQKSKVKHKKFCCDKCRVEWWTKNRDKLKPKHVAICLECGCKFDNGKHKEQKFCSIECYNKHRVKGGEKHE